MFWRRCALFSAGVLAVLMLVRSVSGQAPEQPPAEKSATASPAPRDAAGQPAAQPAAKIEQCLPGVWRVGGGSWGLKGRPALSAKGDCNVYLLRLAQGWALIDCGTLEGLEAVEANVRQAGADPPELTDLLITHSHADHTGAAGQWQARHKLCIHLSAAGAEYLDRRDPCLMLPPRETPATWPPFRVDHRVRDNETFTVAGTQVTAYSVPGHTPDCTLYALELDGKRLGFCGDVCFAPADWDPAPGLVGSLSRSHKSNLADYRASLQRMAKIDLDVLLPGHGRIITGEKEVRANVSAALGTIERFLATPKIYAFGLNRPE